MYHNLYDGMGENDNFAAKSFKIIITKNNKT
jgi:hypothetical protein